MSTLQKWSCNPCDDRGSRHNLASSPESRSTGQVTPRPSGLSLGRRRAGRLRLKREETGRGGGRDSSTPPSPQVPGPPRPLQEGSTETPRGREGKTAVIFSLLRPFAIFLPFFTFFGGLQGMSALSS